jgi:hypothetical protein
VKIEKGTKCPHSGHKHIVPKVRKNGATTSGTTTTLMRSIAPDKAPLKMDPWGSSQKDKHRYELKMRVEDES